MLLLSVSSFLRVLMQVLLLFLCYLQYCFNASAIFYITIPFLMQTIAKERGFYVKALSNVYSNYGV